MPNYDYKCPKCALTLQIFQKINDVVETVCPTCITNMVKRPSAGLAVHFKGSGFYETDYKSKK